MKLVLNSTKIWIANAPVDFRRSIDGLLAIIAEQQEGLPLEDSIFVFYNRYRDKLKILGWHRNGYALLYKRLEQGRFTVSLDSDGYAAMSVQQFSWLFAGLDWVGMSDWQNELTFDDYH